MLPGFVNTSAYDVALNGNLNVSSNDFSVFVLRLCISRRRWMKKPLDRFRFRTEHVGVKSTVPGDGHTKTLAINKFGTRHDGEANAVRNGGPFHRHEKALDRIRGRKTAKPCGVDKQIPDLSRTCRRQAARNEFHRGVKGNFTCRSNHGIALIHFKLGLTIHLRLIFHVCSRIKAAPRSVFLWKRHDNGLRTIFLSEGKAGVTIYHRERLPFQGHSRL